MNQNKQEIHSQLAPHDDDDHDLDSLESYIRATYADETALDELRNLYDDNGGDSRDFHEALTDLAFDALEQNDEFLNNAQTLRKGGLSADEDARLRQAQKDMLERYKRAVAHEAGLPDESGVDAIEAAKAKVSHILSEELQSKPNSKIDDVLVSLGIIVKDKDGNEQFHYPEDLFPAQTNEKWQTYLVAVLEHVRLAAALKDGEASQVETEESEKVRRVAHNAVTTDVQAILGLDRLDDKQWDFVKTRNLLAKMRDHKFPTVDTRESAVTAEAIADGLIGVHALHSLIRKK